MCWWRLHQRERVVTLVTTLFPLLDRSHCRDVIKLVTEHCNLLGNAGHVRVALVADALQSPVRLHQLRVLRARGADNDAAAPAVVLSREEAERGDAQHALHDVFVREPRSAIRSSSDDASSAPERKPKVTEKKINC
jgi:hypothetical protein